jgi:hypothetical protein
MSLLFKHRSLKKYAKKVLSKDSLNRIGRMLRYPEKCYFKMASSNIIKSKNCDMMKGLKNKHTGKRCFIIGSGGSINSMDLRPLKDEITFGFNSFYLIADKVGFMPSYYLVEDSLPAEDNKHVINALNETVKIIPYDLKYCLTPSENTVYVHMDRYYADCPDKKFPRFSNDTSKCVYWGGTVAYMALQLAYYMGLDEVYLIGIDLSYRVENDASVRVGPDKVILSDKNDSDHFHPDYFGKGKRYHLPRTDRMQLSFDYAYNQFSRDGRKLFNATVGGNLKNIPRVDYKTIMVK